MTYIKTIQPLLKMNLLTGSSRKKLRVALATTAELADALTTQVEALQTVIATQEKTLMLYQQSDAEVVRQFGATK